MRSRVQLNIVGSHYHIYREPHIRLKPAESGLEPNHKTAPGPTADVQSGTLRWVVTGGSVKITSDGKVVSNIKNL
jgi:hypothetical protein